MISALWACWLLATSVQAQEPLWQRGVNAWGAQGIWFTDAAVAPLPTDVLVGLGQTFYTARGLFAVNDTLSAGTTHLLASWAPIQHLQLGIDLSVVNATYDTIYILTFGSIGNPILRAKWGMPLGDAWAVGVGGTFAVPTYTQGSSVSTFGDSANLRALVTYHPASFAEASLNVGFTWDRSTAPFVPGSLGPEHYVVLQLNQASHIDWSLGLVGRVPQLYIDPFLEVSGSVGGSTLTSPVTARITPGLRLDTYATHWPLEIALGIHVRAVGEPTVGGTFAGLPPWELFLQVAVHLLTGERGDAQWRRQPCWQDSACAAAEVCTQQECVVRPVPPPPPPPPPMTLHGTLRDAVTHAPLPLAQLLVQGYAQTPVHPDEQGHYRTFALPPGAKLSFTASAPGYEDTTRSATPAGDADPDMDFELQPQAPNVHGKVRGAGSSKGLAGAQVIVMSTNLRWSSDANGAFAGLLPEGTFDLVFTAKGYTDTHRRVDVRGDTPVNLNVELKAQRRR